MRKRIFIFLAVILILLLIPSTLYATATSITYIGAKWNKTSPSVYVTLQKGVDAKYKTASFDALDLWMDKLGSGFEYSEMDNAPSKKNPADITINIKKNTGAVLGSTKISASGGYITGISITMACQNAMGQTLQDIDFTNILTHELGHAFGLGHANDNGDKIYDLMYPYYDFTTVGSPVEISNFDIDALHWIYGTKGFAGTNHSPIPSSYPQP
jgi:hypothetical protein